MLYWLLVYGEDWLKSVHLSDTKDLYAYLNVFRYISFRASMAACTAFAFAVLAGPWFVRWLKTRGVGEKIKSDSEDVRRQHAHKEGTPTMGGLLILVGILGAMLVWGNLGSYYVQLGLLAAVWLAVLGATDDWIKMFREKGSGLTPRQKLLFQIGLGLILGYFLFDYHRCSEYGTKLCFPFFKHGMIDLGWGYIGVVCVVMVACSNAVNLTDGVDGLAGGTVVMAGLGMAVICYVAGHAVLAPYLYVPYMPGSGELAVLCGAVVGATLGFLWFNCLPASVFMGDTGSLQLGGIIGYVAVVTRQELVLLMVGGIFVAEALSVVCQVSSFKMFHRRVLLNSPIHHHFEKLGWPESKIVVRFWIVGALLAVFAIASLKMR